MRKIFYILLSLFLLACEEQDLLMFDNYHEIYFEKYFADEKFPGTGLADSTMVSFFFAEDNEASVYAKLVVCLSGKKLERDIPFSLNVVSDGTTAIAGEYTLEKQYIFRASTYDPTSDMIRDTIQIQMNRSGRLEDLKQGIRLELAIVPTSNLGSGPYERSRAVIVLTKDPVQPQWWTPEVDAELLGTYSPKKYKLFLKNVKGAEELNEEMIQNAPDRVLQLVRAFKSWLTLNPQQEEDGSDMTVNV